ncbi:hypothetical protein Ddye_018160 [Dipteronia dyeriana]|uniref:MULE transposase domain-containing protein n=1 Tax=Dipteronia dyeriana TaxID=168575 RepID=A0AAD9X172_9ROSI|nr:hypothetical protein Ddye_018160 [Dipteronia dyeriana]
MKELSDGGGKINIKRTLSQMKSTEVFRDMIDLACQMIETNHPAEHAEGGALSYIDDLVFIFDRHVSIEAGISKVFPDATHTICCWHFSENVKKQFHRKDASAIMDKATRSYT